VPTRKRTPARSGRQAQGDRLAAAGDEGDHRARLGKAVAELVNDQRQVQDDADRDREEPGAAQPGPQVGRGVPKVDQVDSDQRRGKGNPEDVELDRGDQPDRSDDPPPWPTGPVRLPRRAERDR